MDQSNSRKTQKGNGCALSKIFRVHLKFEEFGMRFEVLTSTGVAKGLKKERNQRWYAVNRVGHDTNSQIYLGHSWVQLI